MAQRQVIRDRQAAIKRACMLINRAARLAGKFPSHPEDCVCENGVAALSERRSDGWQWQFHSEGYGAELIEQLLDKYEYELKGESTMRTSNPGNWWDGLDELNDDGTRRDDRLWEPPVVDYELVAGSAGGNLAPELFDGAEGEPSWDDEVPR